MYLFHVAIGENIFEEVVVAEIKLDVQGVSGDRGVKIMFLRHQSKYP